MNEQATRYPEGRKQILTRHSPGGILPHGILIISTTLAMLLTMSAFTVSCSVIESIFGEAEVTSGISFRKDGDWQVDSVDLFIFRDEEIRTLEYHCRLPYRDPSVESVSDTVRLSKGMKVAVAAANLKGIPDESKLESYETMELMRSEYIYDDPERPVMSGITVFRAGDGCEVDLRPLLCTIILSEVNNNITGYRRLEDPRCYLENVNADAELFRETGFRPTEIINRTQAVPLPCDVGLYTQYPSSHLYCYPNDSQESTVGTPRTNFVLECEINGVTRCFSTELPPLARGCSHTVELTVNSPEDYRFRVF